MTNPSSPAPKPAAPAGRSYKYLPLVTAVFVTALIVSNIIAVKLITLGPLQVSGAFVIFSISYIFGDVLTEVYGYARSRQVIWIGFACNLLAVIAITLAGWLPPPANWTLGYGTAAEAQTAYTNILGSTPLILVASLLAYLVGEFLNSFVVAKLKIATRGRWLWVRTIGSTLVAQVADTGIFVTIMVLGGLYASSDMLIIIGSEWLSKVVYEILATPVTYRVVNFLKRAEQEDYYDYNTDFNPLTLG